MKQLTRLSLLGLAIFAAQAARADLINGSFATDNFYSWTLSEYDPYTQISPWADGYLGVTGDPGTTYFDLTAPDGETLSLSQSFATIAGDLYSFSFDLAHTNYSGDAGAEFTASFGSDTVLSEVGGQEAPILGDWQTESFIVLATGSSTTVTFTDSSPSGYYMLANVDPDPIGQSPQVTTPDQGIGLVLSGCVVLGLCAVARRNLGSIRA
jgi:hypothetical protein